MRALQKKWNTTYGAHVECKTSCNKIIINYANKQHEHKNSKQ